MSKRRMLPALVAGTVALAAAAVAAAATIVVSPGNLNGFTLNNDTCGAAASTGAIAFVTGPATPPAGSGSVKFTVGSNGDSYLTLRHSGYNGVALTSLTALSYSTYVTSFGTGGQAPYIDLKIDNTGDGVADDTLTFEPIYQTGATVSLNAWQSWNALTGLWWSENAGGPPPLFTLTQYNAMHPGAKIVNTSTGGVRLAAGCGGAAWTNFVGYADKLTINGTTYNFEAAKAGKGKGGKKDHKVVICHNGHTITVDQHAVPAHLAHGDKLGPC